MSDKLNEIRSRLNERMNRGEYDWLHGSEIREDLEETLYPDIKYLLDKVAQQAADIEGLRNTMAAPFSELCAECVHSRGRMCLCSKPIFFNRCAGYVFKTEEQSDESE